ncbi:MAG: transcription antiterminator [Lachnospiraceae bacterium]|nr:transcription antiterminator [Lachnospiraceae bacterium]
MLGERLTNLLSLLAQDEFKSLEELASKMNLSSKTLSKLLKELDEKLRSNGAQILSKRGVGYMLEVTEPNTFQAMFLSAEQRQKPPTDASQRVQFIIEQFLKSSDYIKIEEICDAVFVSRKTLAADMKKAEEFFEEFHLSMERKPHYGMRLRGEEFQMRQCITRYQQIKNEKTPGSRLAITPDERQIAELLLEMLEDEEYRISDVGLNSLVLHIAVSIKRVREGQYVSIPEEEVEDLIQEEDYRLAENCARRISRSMDIQFPKEELRYLAIHFAGKESGRNLVINSDIQRAVKEMLQEIYEVFQFDVRDDLELIMALGRHLVPLVIRMKYGMRLTNPLLQEVKKRYSLAYAMAVQSCFRCL